MRPSRCDLGGGLWGPGGPQHPFTPRRSPQESISDFYWYYSGKDVIEEQGKRNFSKAMSVAKQVFNSLTEYIQVGPALWGGARHAHPLSPRTLRPAWALTAALCPQGPCTGNQQSLAHSRLWDAVVGFLHVFAHMMMKLAQVRDPLLFFLQLFSGIPEAAHFQGSFSPKSPWHVPEEFPRGGQIHLPSGLALCMTPPPPLPPPIGWFPMHTSIGLTFGPRPLGPGVPL